MAEYDGVWKLTKFHRAASLVSNIQPQALKLTGVVGLHPLECMDEHTATSEVISLLLGLNGTLDCATGPESMAHGTPRVRRIRSEIGGPILADNETRRLSPEGQVHQAVFIGCRLDRVAVPVRVEGQ